VVIKRFTYENGLDIIVPLKCGIRWLEEKTNPIKIEELHTISKIKNITKDTYWVYRDGKEHLLSALKTEIRGVIEFKNGDVNRIISSFLNGTGTHWSPIIFNYMYNHWNKVEFKLIDLNDLSNLFPGIPYDPNNYNFNHYQNSTDVTSTIIEMVDTDILKKLLVFVEKDKNYLNMILNKEHTNVKLV